MTSPNEMKFSVFKLNLKINSTFLNDVVIESTFKRTEMLCTLPDITGLSKCCEHESPWIPVTKV